MPQLEDRGARGKAGLSYTNKPPSTMPVLTRSQRRSEISEETVRSDTLEKHLSTAEDQVATALEIFAYDEIIAVASEALKSIPQTPSKTLIKSRKNLLWARSHAYHVQSRHELALKDAKAALKMDPDDIAAYVRAAVLLGNTGFREKAMDCLATADALASKYNQTTRSLWRRRIERQRRKVINPSSRDIDRLPNEMLIKIASHLDSRGLNSMCQTCQRWRQVLISAPGLWTSLTIRIEVQSLSGPKALDWIRYIVMRSERANHCLESVEFSRSFPEALLGKVCGILRSSAATLKHIKIPVRQHQLCYDELLQYCPRLEVLVFDRNPPVSIPNSVLDACPDVPMPPKSGKIEPFSLKHFSVTRNENESYQRMNQHLHNLRYLKGYNPFVVTTSGEFDDKRLALSLAEHLEEWHLEGTIEQVTLSPLRSITFSNLTFLSFLDISKLRGPLKFSFPRLLDLQVVLGATSDIEAADRFLQLMQNSPMLRKLRCFSFGRLRSHVDVRPALLGLRDLEQLDYGLVIGDDMERLFPDLLPKAVSLKTDQTDLSIPWPKLHTLALNAQQFDLTKLTFTLLVRERLRLGDNLTAAKQLASERLLTLPKGSAPAVSPFQRGSSSTDTPRPLPKLKGPSLKDTRAIARLQHVELVSVMEIPDNVKLALDSVTDELIIKHTPL